MTKRHLDLDLLRAFTAVVDAASFSQAAAVLGRSQSAVSLQIKRLEELVARPLLERTQGRVQGLTPDGHVLLDYAREMLRLNDTAYRCFADPTPNGTLRVGLPEYLMEWVYPEAVKAFRAMFPRMNVVASSNRSAQLLAELDTGALDLALHVARADDKGATRLWCEPLVWVAAKDFAYDRAAPLPLALFSDACALRIAVTAALAHADIAWNMIYAATSYAGLRNAVASGLAVTALPPQLLQPGLVVIENELPPLPELTIAVKYAGAPHAAALLLVELLTRRAAARAELYRSGAAMPPARAGAPVPSPAARDGAARTVA